jgi:hypothetical protein
MAFGYYKSVTIDHTQCGIVDSTDFPIAIWVTDADLKTIGNGGYVQNGNGYDIRPYADSALTTALTYELVASTYVATTGAVELHVKIPTISHTADTVFYLAFGDSGISTDGSSTSTWSNNYTLVSHFPNGSSLTVNDSTANAYNGTNSGGTAVAGLVDGAIAVTGGNKVTFPSTPVDTILNNGDFTISLWIYPTTLPSTVGVFDTTQRELSLFIISNKIGYGGIGGNQGALPGTLTYTTGAWQMIQWLQTVSGVTTNLYKDFTFDFQTAFPAAGTRSETWHLGDNPSGGGTGSWDGYYDELRLATGARSTSWLAVEYANEKPSATLLTYGARTPTSGGATPTTRLPLLGVG